MIRILHVVYSLSPGGMENGLVNVATRLPKEEFEVFVCCLVSKGEFANRLPAPQNVICLNLAPGFSFRAARQLYQIIRQHKIDVVHTHNVGTLIYGSLASAFGRVCPVFHGEHGQLEGPEATPRALWYRRVLYPFCRRVHTVSDGLRNQLIALGYSAEKVIAIINGVDADRFVPVSLPQAKVRIGLPAEDIVLGSVGRLTKKKRFIELIEAFELLYPDFPALRLMIVGGNGPDRELIFERARRSKYAERIFLAGQQDDPLPFYQAMDLLVAPSLFEGMSNVVLEAMSCGVPVLAHDACGNSEVIRDGVDGFVKNMENSQAIREQIRIALSQPAKIKEAGQQARQTILNRFSLGGMVGKYTECYRSIASAN